MVLARLSHSTSSVGAGATDRGQQEQDGIRLAELSDLEGNDFTF